MHWQEGELTTISSHFVWATITHQSWCPTMCIFYCLYQPSKSSLVSYNSKPIFSISQVNNSCLLKFFTAVLNFFIGSINNYNEGESSSYYCRYSLLTSIISGGFQEQLRNHFLNSYSWILVGIAIYLHQFQKKRFCHLVQVW